MKFFRAKRTARRLAAAAFTLAEVVTSIGVSTLTLSGIISGYVMANKQADWSAAALAAQSLAIQRIEQTSAARWDTTSSPPVDELTSQNFPTVVQPLALPTSGTNIAYATNVTTITTISTDPPLRMVRTECTWEQRSYGVFTNIVTIYRTPDS